MQSPFLGDLLALAAIQRIEHQSVVVDQLSYTVILGNNIQFNPEAGIIIADNSAARVGFNYDDEIMAAVNAIESNTVGILVTNASSARIIGNKIINNSSDGVIVSRESHADIAGNIIDFNGGDGVEIGANSVVQLGEDSGVDIFSRPNTGLFSSSSQNSGFGLRCGSGGVEMALDRPYLASPEPNTLVRRASTARYRRLLCPA